jgi:Cu(I)/Ag(I) efflux system membrane fusion protein
MNTHKTKKMKMTSIKYLLAGVLIATLLPSCSSTGSKNGGTYPAGKETATVWTCSMHPQIRKEKPGQCPICGMTLVPVTNDGEKKDSTDMPMSDVQTTRVGDLSAVRETSLYGTVAVDEELSQSQTAHLGGRIERLLVDYVGQTVTPGQTIATLYSPDLLSAQQELHEALAARTAHPELLQAAREKLRLWKLSDSQIAQMEQADTPSPYIDLQATTGGIVTARRVNTGDYVSRGSVLYDVADLSRVWLQFDAYESDLPFLHVGDKLSYTLPSLPGHTFAGNIAFISPVLDPATRTARVRVEAANADGALKPAMYATATVRSTLAVRDGEVVVPRSAILWTGRRSIVYVKQPHHTTPTFAMRNVELGPSLGDSYLVMAGISPGEEVVTNGAFAIDADAQLAGRHSMMN